MDAFIIIWASGIYLNHLVYAAGYENSRQYYLISWSNSTASTSAITAKAMVSSIF